MKQTSMEIHPIIRQIIDRDCHVATSSREVVQHVISRLKSGNATFQAMSAGDRSLFVEQCVTHHRANFTQYVEVMSGFTRTTKDSQLWLATSLSGKELITVMRKNRVTIRELSERMSIPMKTIRARRETGIDDPHVLRDWIQAITGRDPGPQPRVFKSDEDLACGFCSYQIAIGETHFLLAHDAFCSLTCCRLSRAE